MFDVVDGPLECADRVRIPGPTALLMRGNANDPPLHEEKEKATSTLVRANGWMPFRVANGHGEHADRFGVCGCWASVWALRV
jgi:hypothetical protein